MYKVEIVTVVGTFIAIMPDEINEKVDIRGALEYAEGMMASNQPLELEDLSLFRPWNLQQVVGVRAFRENATQPKKDPWDEDAKTPIPTTPWTSKPGQITVWRDEVSFMAQIWHPVILATCDNADRAYFLLFSINGGAAYDMISVANTEKFVAAWLTHHPGYVGQPFTVVVPHGAIYDQEEAQSYLLDYVKDNQGDYTAGEKTGKAWTGYTEDRGRAL